MSGILQPSNYFRRYVVAVQYHGASFLGFTSQRDENCITSDGTDLRGYYTVESRLRYALTSFLGGGDGNNNNHNYLDHQQRKHYYNIQVSSRTDRGVHAIKNTCHIDIPRTKADNLTPQQIHRGLNYHLARQGQYDITQNYNENNSEESNPFLDKNNGNTVAPRKRLRNGTYNFQGSNHWVRHSMMNELRILNVQEAPATMPNYNWLNDIDKNDTSVVEWNARFSAIEKTYVYRILLCHRDHGTTNDGYYDFLGIPFEWDRSWIVYDKKPFDIEAMHEAAKILEGKHDFTSFRTKGCQRQSPVVTIHNIQIQSQPYTTPIVFGISSSDFLGGKKVDNERPSDDSAIIPKDNSNNQCQLITILYRGDSFLYRQVRNMTGCLVEVGRGKICPDAIQEILNFKDRSQAPSTAPPQGLFLVDVKHIGIDI